MNTSYSSPFMRPPLSALLPSLAKPDFSLLDERALDAGLLASMQRTLEPSNAAMQSKRFICQDSILEDARYYEQIIFEDNTIPTRKGSWHDFFNGIVWLQFPQTKAYLNQLHISEIETHGLNPRSKVRNHITHFDECGVVLFIHGESTFSKCKLAFERQNWNALFCSYKEQWHREILPVIFGHANLEMLLNPFIGLTAKVLLIQIDTPASMGNLFASEDQDALLLKHLKEEDCLFAKKPFYPLPLLGVPNWHYAEQDADFYANTNYFMPKRQ